ncbi:PepSY domain-containing protein [Alcanivorax sp.]|uniref:PepSY domain-containing protein n=1 Tax=Alcanivorax sp. TaxID=1872427 RepID=UPI000C3B2A60|nr:PepSY domain-containing protein [Alcanivorax sp.]MBQ24031.1 peptidase [Alcanivorax sp.]|tara:strand:+ start:133 stop:441 length:309 start_codon:yes stop_codon:yes gene_type:complete
MTLTKTTLIAAVLGLASVSAVQADDVPHSQIDSLVKDGTIQSLDKLDKVAMDKHPDAKITDTELENEYGRYIYQVELRDPQGAEWDLDIDASNGEVLGEERD